MCSCNTHMVSSCEVYIVTTIAEEIVMQYRRHSNMTVNHLTARDAVFCSSKEHTHANKNVSYDKCDTCDICDTCDTYDTSNWSFYQSFSKRCRNFTYTICTCICIFTFICFCICIFTCICICANTKGDSDSV